MAKIAFIFITTYVLLCSFYSEQQKDLNPFFKRPVSSTDINLLSENQCGEIKDPKLRAMAQSYIFGINKNLDSTLKSIHQALNLKHLFSPGGIHLSSLFFWILWLKKRKTWAKYLWFLILLSLIVLSQFLPDYFPLKRTLLFQSILFLSVFFQSRFKIRISNFILFILCFVIDFFHSYQKAELSFIFSFLFWGVIICEHNFTRRIFFLGCAQLLIAYFTKQNVYLLSLVIAPLLNTLFSLLFPFVFFPLFTPFYIISELSLKIFYDILLVGNKLTTSFKAISVNEFFIFFLFLFFFYQLVNVPKRAFLLLLILSINIKEIDEQKEERLFKRSYIQEKKKGHHKDGLLIKI